jgi:hypothetical protein
MSRNEAAYAAWTGRGEGDLGEFLREIWAARFFMAVGLVLGLAAAVLFLFVAVPHYRAEMTVAPAAPMQSVQKISEGLSYTGQNVTAAENKQDQNFQQFQAVARGATLSTLLLRNSAMEMGLNADRSFRFGAQAQAWSPESLAEYIARNVKFLPVGETDLRVMRYMHPDPVFAKEFLRRIAALADGLIRHDVRTAANERIAYLQNELSKNLNPEHRRALTDLLMEQERLRVMVSIDQPYAAVVVEDAFSSSRARWPDAMLVFPAFMAAGAFIGFVVFSVRLSARQKRLATQEPSQHHVPHSMRGWADMHSQNSNERPLTGGGQKPFSSSDAAE